jgi:iron complex transport system substrate-binding protein
MRLSFGRVALALAAVLSACSPSIASRLPGAPSRIVSLIPSLTEDLCAIGAAKQLVGVSQFSSDIPCAKGLPAVDDAATIDAEKIVALHPNLVVGIPSQRRAVDPLIRAGIAVQLLRDDSFADLFDDIAKLGTLSGHGPEATTLIAKLSTETQRLQKTEHFKRRPTVFIVLQTTPVWTVGPQSYISTLVWLAGGRNAVTTLPQAYAQYSPEALLRLQPDALLATRDAQLEQNLDREPWRSLRAVGAKHLLIAPDANILYRPGPRYIQGLSWLIAQLRPIAR